LAAWSKICEKKESKDAFSENSKVTYVPSVLLALFFFDIHFFSAQFPKESQANRGLQTVHSPASYPHPNGYMRLF
jgi:hypothetical protein